MDNDAIIFVEKVQMFAIVFFRAVGQRCRS